MIQSTSEYSFVLYALAVVSYDFDSLSANHLRLYFHVQIKKCTSICYIALKVKYLYNIWVNLKVTHSFKNMSLLENIARSSRLFIHSAPANFKTLVNNNLFHSAIIDISVNTIGNLENNVVG
jgi:hypothetical protein